MDRDLQSITKEALALDPESRAVLVDTLAASIANEHEFLEEKLDELERRWKSIETGEARTVSLEEAVSNARHRIAR
ncbi:MAG TPA: addiction module protein [Candidatus Kapabacteria bacterium]|jgi:putative addiction module component (TIGR02574 family)|nr:addiction module protein [Candidatus Kapabacteria bacterium]